MDIIPTDSNQTRLESDGSALFLLAEGLVLLLSLLRIFVVAIVFAVNIIALRRCSRMVKCHCLHLYVSDSVKICSVVYISTWAPFLVYSLLNGRWLLIDEQIFCLIQNYMTNAILLIFLALGALLGYNRIASRVTGPKLSACLILAAWIFPQLIYFIILTTLESNEAHNKLDFNFLDDLLGISDGDASIGITYKIGFTICGQNLCRLALTQYIFQYVTIVLPICISCILVLIRHLCTPFNMPTYLELNNEKIPNDAQRQCHCLRGGAESPALEIILGANAIWIVLVRPLILLMWSPDHLFIDLGSHLMLTIAAVFAPILPQQLLVRPSFHIHNVNNLTIRGLMQSPL